MDSYKTLVAWQRAHEALITTLKATDRYYHARARAVFDQLRRAIVSIEANIVEGYALRTPLLFRRHLRIALGSAAEAECLVRVCAEMEYPRTAYRLPLTFYQINRARSAPAFASFAAISGESATSEKSAKSNPGPTVQATNV